MQREPKCFSEQHIFIDISLSFYRDYSRNAAFLFHDSLDGMSQISTRSFSCIRRAISYSPDRCTCSHTNQLVGRMSSFLDWWKISMKFSWLDYRSDWWTADLYCTEIIALVNIRDDFLQNLPSTDRIRTETCRFCPVERVHSRWLISISSCRTMIWCQSAWTRDQLNSQWPNYRIFATTSLALSFHYRIKHSRRLCLAAMIFQFQRMHRSTWAACQSASSQRKCACIWYWCQLGSNLYSNSAKSRTPQFSWLSLRTTERYRLRDIFYASDWFLLKMIWLYFFIFQVWRWRLLN